MEVKTIKATVRCSGRVIEVYQQKDKFIEVDRGEEWKAEELDFAKDIDWQQVSIQASIAAMQAELTNPNNVFSMCDDKLAIITKRAIRYADALVAELKHSEDVYAECRRLTAINTASVCENMTKIQKELQKKGDEQ